MIKNYLKLFVALVFVTNLMAQNVPSYLPKDGLVGWWPFNGNANDESGNGNHGTVNGATLTTDRNGKANSAFSFDGIDDFILTSNTKSNITEKTFCAWVKLNNINQTGGGLVGIENTKAIKFDAIVYNELTTGWGFGSDNFTRSSWSNIKEISSDWAFMVAVYQDKNYKLYRNGTLILTNKSFNAYTFVGGSQINFGLRHTGAKEFLKGNIDDIAIYNRALTDQEVKQLYEGCTKETATSSNFNSVIYTTNNPVTLSATPSGGTFNGEAVTNNAFNPSKAKLGKNQVKYNFKNSTGCADSTNFTMILVDTLGNKCSTYDTLKIKVQLTTGIKAGQLTSMNVYPNPTSDVIIIEASDVAALNGYSYKMVDLQGKQVYKELVTTSKTEISLKSIGEKGVYILHVLDAQGVSIENKKIVLE